MSRLITRGLGRGLPGNQGLVTQGYGGLLAAAKAQAQRLIKAGASGAKRAIQEIQEVVIWAGLIRVNDDPPAKKIQGSIRVRLDEAKNFVVTAGRQFSRRVRNIADDIKISIKRIR